ncbi:hypothetical protein HUA74_32790 [Myxococcus sp. CA051A]|uniref:hypothetical protein n=1 Tax=unclassified Myxococcus TaxID=2648731 RepID=UPI00157A2326|nr:MULTISPECIES: hypothetical protein [unclassified Myxococcus]NTX00187.1 hypothetical protein [Myxococcus sp. CA040A]NTX53216.1 hypothetical protein [Myxococcus sp. CA039A]NTX65447.1 hypothetical protein [Myxococcus sp. CA051A]
MNDEVVLAALRTEGEGLSAVELAALLERLTGSLSQTVIVFYLKRAFPHIPLRILIESGAWSRVGTGKLSDDQFNELLRPWLGQ